MCCELSNGTHLHSEPATSHSEFVAALDHLLRCCSLSSMAQPFVLFLNCRLPRDRFFQFSWRPRAASLLTAEQKEAIRKNLPDKIKEWDREHVARAEEANREVLEKRQRLRDEWKTWVESTAEWVAQQEAFKKEIMGDKYAERDFKMVEVLLTETISVQDELYKEV